MLHQRFDKVVTGSFQETSTHLPSAPDLLGQPCLLVSCPAMCVSQATSQDQGHGDSFNDPVLPPSPVICNQGRLYGAAQFVYSGADN